MPGAHYALSEALIVGAAIWCALRLSKIGLSLAALGIVMLGAAAGIGVYRFGTGQIDEWAMLHASFSRFGGAISIILVAGQLVLQHLKLRSVRALGWPILFAIGISAILVFAMPQLATGLSLGWLVVAIVSAATFPYHFIIQRTWMAGLVSIFLFNLLFIRRSATLGPDLSWHLFHIIVAVWIVAMAWVLGRTIIAPLLQSAR